MVGHNNSSFTGARQIRVLVVDDSRTMRKILRAIVESDPRLTVVAEASCASEARDAINSVTPDVMTLDVEMPKMNGLEFLKRVMRHRPMPVIMVSSMTKKGSNAAIAALAHGAVECIEKPNSSSSSSSLDRLPELIRIAASARTGRNRGPVTGEVLTNLGGRNSNNRYVCIGGSTGAVEAIERLLSSFPADCPCTLITQHMPAPFLSSFAARLDPRVAPTVKLAEDGERLEPGKVLIAPGGATHLAVSAGASPSCSLVEAPERNGHRPSVDVLFETAAALGNRAVGAILTGMGNDGAAGLLQMKQNGAKTVGQSQESCVVFGMPRVAGEYGAVDDWRDLNDMAAWLLDGCWAETKRAT